MIVEWDYGLGSVVTGARGGAEAPLWGAVGACVEGRRDAKLRRRGERGAQLLALKFRRDGDQISLRRGALGASRCACAAGRPAAERVLPGRRGRRVLVGAWPSVGPGGGWRLASGVWPQPGRGRGLDGLGDGVSQSRPRAARVTKPGSSVEFLCSEAVLLARPERVLSPRSLTVLRTNHGVRRDRERQATTNLVLFSSGDRFAWPPHRATSLLASSRAL